MKAILAAAVFTTLLSFARVNAQQVEKLQPPSPVAVAKMVSIILTEEFKPAMQPRTIYLSDQFVKASSLPKIENIEFVLLNDADFEKRGEGYLFSYLGPELAVSLASLDVIQVDFGFGKVSCGSSGWSYFFNVASDRVERNSGHGTWSRHCPRKHTVTKKRGKH
jgi:hypothetical protein